MPVILGEESMPPTPREMHTQVYNLTLVMGQLTGPEMTHADILDCTPLEPLGGLEHERGQLGESRQVLEAAVP